MTRFLLTTALLLSGAAAQEPTPSAQVQRIHSYTQLVARAKQGDPTVDYAELRTAYSDWLCQKDAQIKAPNCDEMVKAFEGKDYDKATKLVEVVLDYEYVHRGLHLAAAEVYDVLSGADKKTRARVSRYFDITSFFGGCDQRSEKRP